MGMGRAASFDATIVRPNAKPALVQRDRFVHVALWILLKHDSPQCRRFSACRRRIESVSQLLGCAPGPDRATSGAFWSSSTTRSGSRPVDPEKDQRPLAASLRRSRLDQLPTLVGQRLRRQPAGVPSVLGPGRASGLYSQIVVYFSMAGSRRRTTLILSPAQAIATRGSQRHPTVARTRRLIAPRTRPPRYS